MKTFATRLAPVIALFSAALAITPAAAGDVSFSFKRSDLANTASISALYERLEAKADRACNLYQNSKLFGVEYQKACAAPLMDELVAAIDHPRLSALHEERSASRFAEFR